MPDATFERGMSIGVLSKRSGVNIETIRYYEGIDLIPPPARTRGGHRTFDDLALRRLSFIKRCRDLGFTLDDIRGLMTPVSEGRYTCAQIASMTEQHLANIRGKIDSLRRMETVLVAMLGDCDRAAAPECAIIDALYSEQFEPFADAAQTG